MTAEIAIMNKRAIALAADSAVTIGDRTKFYNTANKLFMLSKYEPLGIMIYNNAEFMGIPWDIIIKNYRCHLGDSKKDYLIEYGDNFINKLKENEYKFETYEKKYYIQMVLPLINEISKKIEDEYFNLAEKLDRKLNHDEVSKIANNIIDLYFDKIYNAKDLDDVPENLTCSIESTYSDLCKKYIGELVGTDIMDNEHLDKLISTCNLIFQKDIFLGNYTGVVISGFGDKDNFPSLVCYKISGFIKNFLKYKVDIYENVTLEMDQCIIPFAQVDIVNTFLRGISLDYLNIIQNSFDKYILGFIDNLDKDILKEDDKKCIKTELNLRWEKVLDDIMKHSQKEYLVPVLKAIRYLPIDDLSSMAESLVNLTSFKRQVAVDEKSSTVGGPVDVAVISKCDGFIWIKRKHYFKPEYNYHFFQNYYKKMPDNCKEEYTDD
ncbi:hypothetical protein [Clostridium ihumii]|uniref:hypothetical protein n=1 Tax=Clostridium ihumii TaxID=1470356 RepID=UPI00058C5E86|nr:hypothetical protein [Clostridium ihumii]